MYGRYFIRGADKVRNALVMGGRRMWYSLMDSCIIVNVIMIEYPKLVSVGWDTGDQVV